MLCWMLTCLWFGSQSIWSHLRCLMQWQRVQGSTSSKTYSLPKQSLATLNNFPQNRDWRPQKMLCRFFSYWFTCIHDVSTHLKTDDTKLLKCIRIICFELSINGCLVFPYDKTILDTPPFGDTPLGDSPILIGSQSRDRRLLILITADSVAFKPNDLGKSSENKELAFGVRDNSEK